jgi:hypothetical protein
MPRTVKMAPYQRRGEDTTWGQHLYVMHAGAGAATGLVKIGRSWSPHQRLEAVRRSCPMMDVELRGEFPNLGVAESLVLAIMRRAHPRVGRSEWFACSDSEAVAAVAEALRMMREIQGTG